MMAFFVYSVPFHLSILPSNLLPICLLCVLIQATVHPAFTYLSVYLSFHLSYYFTPIHWYIHLSVHLYLSICLSIHLAIHPSVHHRSIHTSIPLFVHSSIHFSIYFSIHPSIHVSTSKPSMSTYQMSNPVLRCVPAFSVTAWFPLPSLSQPPSW